MYSTRTINPVQKMALVVERIPLARVDCGMARSVFRQVSFRVLYRAIRQAKKRRNLTYNNGMQSPVVPECQPVPESLLWAHPVVREWFVRRFSTPTEPQELGWPHILAGKPALISAPTGSGKTLAAFLIAIDTLLRQAIEGRLESATQVVYVSPLKALSNDIQKNLETPLREIQELALECGYLCPPIRA